MSSITRFVFILLCVSSGFVWAEEEEVDLQRAVEEILATAKRGPEDSERRAEDIRLVALGERALPYIFAAWTETTVDRERFVCLRAIQRLGPEAIVDDLVDLLGSHPLSDNAASLLARSHTIPPRSRVAIRQRLIETENYYEFSKLAFALVNTVDTAANVGLLEIVRDKREAFLPDAYKSGYSEMRWVLARLGDRDVLEQHINAVKQARDPWSRFEAIRELVLVRRREIVPVLIPILDERDDIPHRGGGRDILESPGRTCDIAAFVLRATIEDRVLISSDRIREFPRQTDAQLDESKQWWEEHKDEYADVMPEDREEESPQEERPAER